MSLINTCQVPVCTNPQFTYCLHCSLYVCINCLNKHYICMQNDYKQELLNFQIEFNLNHQRSIDQLDQISKQLSDNKLNQYKQFKKFLSNKFDHNGNPNIINFQMSDYLELKKTYTLLTENQHKFDQLLDQINQLIVNFQDDNNKDSINTTEIIHSSRISTSSELNTDNSCSDIKSESVLTTELDDDNEPAANASSIGNLATFVENSISQVNATSYSAIESICYNHDETLSKQVDSQVIYSIEELKEMSFPCPLIKHSFGLQESHCQSDGIANIPCPISEEENLCLFQHLRQYHYFTVQSALKIVRTLAYPFNQLDQIDLFSNETNHSLVRTSFSSYRGICPLYKYGVYGILPEHQVKLCVENHRNKIHLHYHMRAVHKLKPRYATLLVQAIMNNNDKTIPIIKVDEQIVCH